MKVEVEVGSLDQELGMVTTICPPEGIWFLGLSVKTKGEYVLTKLPVEVMEQAEWQYGYIGRSPRRR